MDEEWEPTPTRGCWAPRPLTPGPDRTLHVALGRRVEVIGDLLLPSEPTDSSRAACRDIARRLEEWQGPGIVILCGRLVAPGCHDDPSGAVDTHPELADALGAFAARADSQVIVVMAPSERDPALVQALERRGVTVRDGVDLACETGAGTRTVLVRAGSLRPDGNPPVDAAPDRRPALAGRHGAPRRPAAGAPLRHLARAVPAVAPLPLGATARAGRDRAVAARRIRGRRSGPGVPHTPAADRPAAGLRRHLALPLHRHGGDRAGPPGGLGRRGGHHVARHLARARGRGPARAVGRRPVGSPADRARPAPTGRRGRARTRRGPPSRPGPRASSSAGRWCPS